MMSDVMMGCDLGSQLIISQQVMEHPAAKGLTA